MINQQANKWRVKMELLLKWIPNSNPDLIGRFQLVSAVTEEVEVEGEASEITDFIKAHGLTSKCGWIWS